MLHLLIAAVVLTIHGLISRKAEQAKNDYPVYTQ